MALTACQLEELLEHLANGLCSVDADGNIRTISDDLKDIRNAIVAQGPNTGVDGGDGGEGGDGGDGGDGGTSFITALNNLVATNVTLVEQNQQLVGQMSDLVVAFCEPCEDARGRAIARIKQVKEQAPRNLSQVNENAIAESNTRRAEKATVAREAAVKKVALPTAVTTKQGVAAERLPIKR